MTKEPETHTVAQAAKRFGVHPNTLYRAIADGELEAIRIRRRVLIPRAVLEAWLHPTSGDTDV